MRLMLSSDLRMPESASTETLTLMSSLHGHLCFVVPDGSIWLLLMQKVPA